MTESSSTSWTVADRMKRFLYRRWRQSRERGEQHQAAAILRDSRTRLAGTALRAVLWAPATPTKMILISSHPNLLFGDPAQARFSAVCGVPSRMDVRILVNWRNSGQLIYARPFSPSALGLDIRLPFGRRYRPRATMLRIERSANGQVVFTLSGRMQTADLDQVQQVLVVEEPERQLTFDLRNVTLVNHDVVRFLGDCEMKGIKPETCPLHIRNWIEQERRRTSRRRGQKARNLKLPRDS